MTDNTKTADEGSEDLAALVARLQAEVVSERAEKEKVNSKNRELIAEKQAARAATEAAELQAAERNGDIEALKTAHTKELQKLQAKLDAADSDLRTIRIDNELTRAYTEKGRPELAEQFIAWAKGRVQYENGAASVDGASIGDFVDTYLGSANGAHFRRVADTSGTGATGNNSTVAPLKLTKPPVTQAEWDYLDSLAPDVRNALCESIGAPKLKV